MIFPLPSAAKQPSRPYALAYLHQFRVDELKIDQAFVRDLSVRDDQRVLVAAMVAMARAFGLQVVAEGVETEADTTALRHLGCQTAQGYLYARPQAAKELTRSLRATPPRPPDTAEANVTPERLR